MTAPVVAEARPGRPAAAAPSRGRRRYAVSARVAAALAFASAAVTLYWTLGGTAGLDTLGGTFEKLARSRSAASIGLGAMVVIAKLAAAALALALLRGPARLLARTAIVGGALLALYGAVLVGAGALVLTGIIDPSAPVDEYGLRWHVAFWDLWFLLWGIALGVGGWHAQRARPAG